MCVCMCVCVSILLRAASTALLLKCAYWDYENYHRHCAVLTFRCCKIPKISGQNRQRPDSADERLVL